MASSSWISRLFHVVEPNRGRAVAQPERRDLRTLRALQAARRRSKRATNLSCANDADFAETAIR